MKLVSGKRHDRHNHLAPTTRQKPGFVSVVKKDHHQIDRLVALLPHQIKYLGAFLPILNSVFKCR